MFLKDHVKNGVSFSHQETSNLVASLLLMLAATYSQSLGLLGVAKW